MRKDPRHPYTASLQRLTLPILGFGCSGGGALTVERSLARLHGISRVYVNPATEVAYVEFDANKCSPGDVIAAIERTGFRVIVLDRSASGLSQLAEPMYHRGAG